jgi:hypothetical protein
LLAGRLGHRLCVASTPGGFRIYCEADGS